MSRSSSRRLRQALHRSLACVSLLAASTAFAAPPTYRIELLDKSNSIKPTYVNAISDNGNIAGCGRDSRTGSDVSYLKRSGAKSVALKGSSGYCSFEGDVNDAGDVLSEYLRDEGNILTVQGALWTRDGVMTDLNKLAGCDATTEDDYSAIGALNQAGDAAFSIDCKIHGNQVISAVLWRQGKLVFLARMGSRGLPRVNDLNNLGQAAGDMDTADNSSTRAVIWEPDGTVRMLGTLGGSMSFANGINDLGHVVGTSTLPSWESRGFVFDGQTMKELPTCGGKFSPYPTGITNDGLIVGGYGGQKHHHVAVIQDGECFALDALLDASGANWTNLGARSVNNAGVILGKGLYNGIERAYIATPVVR